MTVTPMQIETLKSMAQKAAALGNEEITIEVRRGAGDLIKYLFYASPERILHLIEKYERTDPKLGGCPRCGLIAAEIDRLLALRSSSPAQLEPLESPAPASSRQTTAEQSPLAPHDDAALQSIPADLSGSVGIAAEPDTSAGDCSPAVL